MTLLQRSKQPPALTADDLSSMIVAEQQTHAKLIDRQAALVIPSLTDPAAEAEYKDVTAAMAASDGRIRQLRHGLEAIEQQAAATLADRQRGERAAIAKRVEGILEQRVEAARELEDAIGKSVAAFRRLTDLTGRAHAAFSFPSERLHGLQFARTDIARLVTFELYRQGGAPIQTGGPTSHSTISFPGGKAPNFLTVGKPEEIEPLSVAMTNANLLARRLIEENHA